MALHAIALPNFVSSSIKRHKVLFRRPAFLPVYIDVVSDVDLSDLKENRDRKTVNVLCVDQNIHGKIVQQAEFELVCKK